MEADKSQLEPRQRLLEAAEEIFAEKGFAAATVREICERAGMNIASINYHFGDKEKLYAEAVREAHICTAVEAKMPAWQPDTPPAEKLRDFIRGMLRQVHGPVRPTALRLMMREMANPSPVAEAIIHQYTKPMAHGLREIVRELFPLLTEQQHLMIGFSVVGQCLFYRQNRRVAELLFGKDRVEELDLERVTQHITKFTLAALGLDEPYRTQAGGES